MRYLIPLKTVIYAGRPYRAGECFFATERGARPLLSAKLVREATPGEAARVIPVKYQTPNR